MCVEGLCGGGGCGAGVPCVGGVLCVSKGCVRRRRVCVRLVFGGKLFVCVQDLRVGAVFVGVLYV